MADYMAGIRIATENITNEIDNLKEEIEDIKKSIRCLMASCIFAGLGILTLALTMAGVI